MGLNGQQLNSSSGPGSLALPALRPLAVSGPSKSWGELACSSPGSGSAAAAAFEAAVRQPLPCGAKGGKGSFVEVSLSAHGGRAQGSHSGSSQRAVSQPIQLSASDLFTPAAEEEVVALGWAFFQPFAGKLGCMHVASRHARQPCAYYF